MYALNTCFLVKPRGEEMRGEDRRESVLALGCGSKKETIL